jgi:hypothetical protein
MTTNTESMNLEYRNQDGTKQKVAGCSLYQDKAGRYWLWNETHECNLAYKIKDKEDCLMAAIDSLLFTIKMRDEKIARLQRVADFATRFVEQMTDDLDC